MERRRRGCEDALLFSTTTGKDLEGNSSDGVLASLLCGTLSIRHNER